LDFDIYHDILALWQSRVVTVTAKGRSITEIYVNITSRLERPIKAVLSHGTFFCSKGIHQNMVIRKEVPFLLRPLSVKYMTVPATCIDAERPIPSGKDCFKGVRKVSPRVEQFLRESDGCSSNVVQAGVWAITDGYSREQIKRRLVRTSSGGRVIASISDSDITMAKALLSRLGIPSNLN
jgi:hypothetical protein